MKVVDANVLIYAVNSSDPHHDVARDWLDHALAGRASVGLPWISLIAFLRITTHPTLLSEPLTAPKAMEYVDDWLTRPASHHLEPGPQHHTILGQLIDGSAVGNLVNDAHLAALAIEHRATLVSFDEDFARFPGLRWEWPTGGTTRG